MIPTMWRWFFRLLILLLPLDSVSADIQLPFLLGSCSSPLAGSTPERIQNIRAAVEKISGKILLPGETFSYNQTVGPRTRAAGFLPAPAIVHEALRPVTGGGICQVSSTLFNAVLLSDLKVVERHRHYTPVNYLPLGMDATISWGTKDFRFRNTSPGSVQIIGRVSDSTLTFQIYGEQPLADELRLETEIVESPSPHPDETSEPGIEIKLYRIRQKEGKILARQLIHTDYYPARIVQTPREP
ncbi:MAG: VanW family protein [bacterium]